MRRLQDDNSSSHSVAQIAALHQHLDRTRQTLRFDEPLESQFLDELRKTQYRNTLFTLCAVGVVWLFYAGLDVWRIQHLDAADQHIFFWNAMLPRWLVIVCFVCSLVLLQQPNTSRSQYELCIAGSVIASCIVIVMTSYTLRNLGQVETSVVMVLLVVVASYPLGVRWRIMGPVALLTCLIVTISGPLILEDDKHLPGHWVLSGVMWIALVLSGMTAYLRERSLREQFLLRRLLHWEASHDPLTHLPNRRMFHEHLERTMRQSQREGTPLFLALVDVDHFKRYNDHYGHQAGDTVLCELANVLRSSTKRPLDLAVRLGGEEFGLILFGLEPCDVQIHLDKLRLTLQELNLPHAASPIADHLTISIGVTAVTTDDTQDSAFQRADQWLYQAKSQGRNRACMAPVPHHHASCQGAATARCEAPDSSALQSALSSP